MLHVPLGMSWSSPCDTALPLCTRSVLSHVLIMESCSCLGGVAMASVGSPDHWSEFFSAAALIFFARVGVGITGACGTSAGIATAAIGCVSDANVIDNFGCYVPFSFFCVFCSPFAVDNFRSINKKLEAGDSSH